MNFLNNMKITQRLIALLLVLFMGLVTIALTFYYFDREQKKSNSLQQSYLEFDVKAEKTHLKLLEAIRFEQIFLADNNIEHIEKHKAALKVSKDTIQLMKTTAPESSLQDKVLAIEAEIQSYQTTVESLFEAALALGYGVDENTGTVGEMRGYVHDIEDILKDAKEESLIVSMLTMRRHEKDFQLREDEKYFDRMAAISGVFRNQVNSSSFPQSTKEKLNALLTQYLDVFKRIVAGTKVRNMQTLATRGSVERIEPLVQSLVALTGEKVAEVKVLSQRTNTFLTWFFAGVLCVISAVMIGAMLLLAKSINSPISHFLTVIKELGSGKTDARVQREQHDEIGDLGRAFDIMLNERQQAAKLAEKESEELNDSIIVLMNAAADLSERDFTVKIPVSENVTGAVSDALNMMTNRVSAVLSHIREVSNEVKESASIVHQQGQSVSALADEERLQVERTMLGLNESSKSMNEISELADNCRNIAKSASASTEKALDQVLETALGINEIRSTISETEKRIKRLSERSQEISSVVEIINNVAVQTQVLALNASMQAAAAGEAGRGFSVVADEVQRLAKSSRESTSEITNLVTNIQTETAETMAAMNKAITQVVEGTKMAERSGSQMKETQKITSQLSDVVSEVARNAKAQSEASNKLREESLRITQSTEKTAEQLKKQAEVTDLLVEGSIKLKESVEVFKLQA